MLITGKIYMMSGSQFANDKCYAILVSQLTDFNAIFYMGIWLFLARPDVTHQILQLLEC